MEICSQFLDDMWQKGFNDVVGESAGQMQAVRSI